MKPNINRLKTVIPLWAVTAAGMMMFLYGTAPDRIGPQGITIFFFVAYLFIAVTVQLFVLFLRKMLSRPGELANWRVAYSFIAAFMPVLAIGLDSLDQLVLRDILIFVGLAALVIFYVAKRNRNPSKK